MSKPVAFVLGASGNVGSSTVRHLSSRFADKVEIRAGTRNPDKADKLSALPGVTVVQAEMTLNPDKLVDTLRGVDALFIVTPGVVNKVDLVKAAAGAAKKAGVKFVLALSSLTADSPQLGALAKVCYDTEKGVSGCGVPHAFLRLPFFIDNIWANKPTIQQQSSIFGYLDPTKPYLAILADDIGLAAACILSDPSKHIGKAHNLVGNCYTSGEIATAFSNALGKEVKYVQVPFDMIQQGMTAAGLKEEQIQGLKECFDLINAENKELLPDDMGDFERITGQKPTTLVAWLAVVGKEFAS